MTLDEMSDRYPVLIAVIAVTIWVSTMATLKLLFWLKKYKPEKLEQVGIKHIDGWFACWRGIWLLAFSRHGSDLTGVQRLTLRLVVLSSASLLLIGLIALVSSH